MSDSRTIMLQAVHRLNDAAKLCVALKRKSEAHAELDWLAGEFRRSADALAMLAMGKWDEQPKVKT